MAQAHRYVTVTHFAKVSKDSVLVLHVHVLPENEDGTGSSVAKPTSIGLPPPFSWLEERHMQELMVMVHEVAYTKAVQGLTGREAPKSSSARNKKMELRRGINLRVLFSFKSYDCLQHLLLPTDAEVFPQLTPTIITDQGRSVFQGTGHTIAGNRCQPLQILPESLHMFVDCYEPTSPHGAVKIFTLLNPTHKRSEDIMTYFQPQSQREHNSSDDDEGEEGGMLADLPVAGLKRQRRGRTTARGRRKAKSASATAHNGKKSSKPVKKKGDPPSGKGLQQPTIAESLVSAKEKSASVLTLNSTTKSSGDILDELFAVDSDPCDDVSYSTPPLAAIEEGELQSSTLNPSPDELLSPVPHSAYSPSAGPSSDTSVPVGGLSGKKLSLKRKRQSPGGSAGVDGSEVLEDTNSLLQSQHSTCSLREEQVHFEPNEESEASADSDFPMVVWKGNSHRPTNRLHSSDQVGKDEEEADKGRMDTSEDRTCDFVSPSIIANEKEVSLAEQDSSGVRHSESLLDITNRLHSSPRKGQLQEADYSMLEKTDSELLSGSRPQPTPLKQALTNIPKAIALLDTTPDTVDLTGETSIVVSSGDEGVSPSSSQEGRTAGRMKRRRIVTPHTLFRGAKDLRQISLRSVQKWLCQQKQLLLEIFQRKVYSRRHEDFVSGPKQRAALQYQVNTRQFSKDQVEVITRGLMKAFCSKNMKYFTYVMSVLFPECLVRLIMDFHSIAFEEAERLMFGYEEDA